ncbi:hypothetical protein DKK68_06335 [Bifidobacterium asteroides]|uniref:hypothetical protein n=1 Tax=Bifidobacterium asteroides TaxID=1684 RepID=UPI000D784CB8|nr:hypothetical protein [Bifidobacterium asteroides]PXY87373.1 hypothetical protein DKK68_06335 [Bifidobacterium asteroides]
MAFIINKDAKISGYPEIKVDGDNAVFTDSDFILFTRKNTSLNKIDVINAVRRDRILTIDKIDKEKH